MIVTSDVQRREAAESASQPPVYGPAAANFTAVLYEVNSRNPETRSDARAEGAAESRTTETGTPDTVREGEAATGKTDNTETSTENGTDEAADSSSTDGRTADDGEAGENGAESDVEGGHTETEANAGGGRPGQVPEAGTEAASTIPAGHSADSAPNPELRGELQTEGAEAASAGASRPAVATETNTANEDTSPTPAPENAAGPTGASGNPAGGDHGSGARNGSSGTDQATFRVDGGAGAGAPELNSLFPRTLNAVLAESALRGGAASASARPDTPEPAPEPAPPPAPRAAAMDLSGIRPESTAPPRLPLSNLPGELAQQIHLMQQEGAKTMRIRLVPENLGELRIEIQGSGDTLRVRMISANAAVRDALDSQMGDLKQALQKHGLSLNDATVGGDGGYREAPARQNRAPRAPANTPAPDVAPGTATHGAPPREQQGTPGTLNLLA